MLDLQPASERQQAHGLSPDFYFEKAPNARLKYIFSFLLSPSEGTRHKINRKRRDVFTGARSLVVVTLLIIIRTTELPFKQAP